jgi:hypothetical protein
VVTWDAKGLWRVAWFTPDVCNGELAKFDYSKGAPVALTEKQVKALGLDEATPGK